MYRLFVFPTVICCFRTFNIYTLFPTLTYNTREQRAKCLLELFAKSSSRGFVISLLFYL